MKTPMRIKAVKQRSAIESAFLGTEENFHEADNFASKINKKFK